MQEETTTTTEGQEVEQSTVLDENEVKEVLSEEGLQEKEVNLPSDKEEFNMPDKFAGKSAEDIAKSYLELEKFKSKDQEDELVNAEDIFKEVDSLLADEDSEEAKVEDKEEDKEEDNIEAFDYSEYEKSYQENGGSLTEEDYAGLKEQGFSKEEVDDKIDYIEYKRQKAINNVIDPLGGGAEKLQEVIAWAQENKTSEEIEEFNKVLEASPIKAQQALLKGLYAEADNASSPDGVDAMLHTNTPQTTKGKGYSNESEFMKDLSNPAYSNDPTYIKAVEKKLAATNTTSWSF